MPVPPCASVAAELFQAPRSCPPCSCSGFLAWPSLGLWPHSRAGAGRQLLGDQLGTRAGRSSPVPPPRIAHNAAGLIYSGVRARPRGPSTLPRRFPHPNVTERWWATSQGLPGPWTPAGNPICLRLSSAPGACRERPRQARVGGEGRTWEPSTENPACRLAAPAGGGGEEKEGGGKGGKGSQRLTFIAKGQKAPRRTGLLAPASPTPHAARKTFGVVSSTNLAPQALGAGCSRATTRRGGRGDPHPLQAPGEAAPARHVLWDSRSEAGSSASPGEHQPRGTQFWGPHA